MGILTRIRETLAPDRQADPMVEFLRESISDLSRQLEADNVGWRALGSSDDELTRDALTEASRSARTLAVAHPLVKRALNLRAAYVHGQGVSVTAAGPEAGQDVNAVVADFLSDEGNLDSLVGSQACERLERALGTDGNIAFACFTNPYTGQVQVRTIPFDEIVEKITDPNDRTRTWFYKRVWTQRTVQPSGTDAAATITATHTRVDYYPDLAHFPASRPKTLDGAPIHWESPIYHVMVNDLEGWDFGVGDAFAAVSWSRAYRDVLADWATLVKALSQFAFRSTTKGSRTQVARALARRPAESSPAGNPTNAGATAVLGPETTLEAIPKTGATIDSESGRPLAAMIAAALDVPVTILLADPGVTGARATAETLDQPLQLAMRARQRVWTEVYRNLIGYAILQSVKAPQGALRGTVIRDRWTGREVLTLAGDVPTSIEVKYPPIDKLPVETLMNAIKTADDTGKMPPVETLRLLLSALGIEDVEAVIEKNTDEDGNWIDPSLTAASVAVEAWRRGEDPAKVLR